MRVFCCQTKEGKNPLSGGAHAHLHIEEEHAQKGETYEMENEVAKA